MRWTSLFSPTLRDAPGDAEAESHKLLIRGGYIRQLHSGHYILLPLAHRVGKNNPRSLKKRWIVSGGQQVQMPTLQPASTWQKSGRWESMGEIMFRLEDRHGAEAALGVTARGNFMIVGSEITSYKQLPPNVVSDTYQIS